MKNLTITFVLTFALSLFAFGQVSITLNSFPREATFIDSVFSATSPQTSALPSEGADQVWDYSSIGATSLFDFGYSDASSDVNFPNAFSKSTLSLSFQGFPIEGFSYDALDANGWREIGIHTEAVAHSISAISGGANDTLFFPENIDVYPSSASFLEFPANYQDNWTGTQIETTPFELTVANFGLQDSPGEQVRTITDSRSIVGYGKLTMPDDNGDPSDELDVLLIKSELSTVDSFFLMGNPAPAQLLAAFGLTQGNTSSSEAYLFYMPDYGKPILRIGVNAMGTSPSGVAYRPDAARKTTTSINRLDFADELEIYPNPINAGQAIMINFNEMLENAEITLTDMTGRVVQRNRIDAQLGFARFETSDLASGVYILNVNTQNGALLKHTKVVVK